MLNKRADTNAVGLNGVGYSDQMGPVPGDGFVQSLFE